MKAGWKTAKLGDLLTKTATIDPSKRPNDPFEYIDVSSVSNVTFAVSEASTLLGKDAPSRARRHVKKGDVIFATVRPTLQRIAVIPDEYDDAICSTGYFVMRVGPNLDHRFLFYWLLSDDFSQEMEARQKGASYPAVNDSDIRDQIIPLPPLAEQRRIVAVLDEAFAAIATATANAEKNLANARGLFEATFAQTLVKPGPGWSVVAIQDIAELVSGQHIDASDYNNEQRGIGYLTGPSDFGAHTPTVTKWTEHPKRTAILGDILITVKGSGVGRVNVMTEGELAISRQLMAVRVKATDPELVYFALETKFDHFQSLANGAAIPGISRSDVLCFKVAIPPKSELTSFMGRLHSLQKNFSNLSDTYIQQIANLNQLKQSLLHCAFNGELTAVAPETIAATPPAISRSRHRASGLI